MSFDLPGAWWLLVPLALLLWWRRRGAPNREEAWGSLELWREALAAADRRPGARWPRALWAEALLGFALITALAGPRLASSATPSSPRVVVDAGAAMRTAPRRAAVEKAIREARMGDAEIIHLYDGAEDLPDEAAPATTFTDWERRLAPLIRDGEGVLFFVDALRPGTRLPAGVEARIIDTPFRNRGWVEAELSGDADRPRLFAAAVRTSPDVDASWVLEGGGRERARGKLSFDVNQRAEIEVQIDLGEAEVDSGESWVLALTGERDELGADDRVELSLRSERGAVRVDVDLAAAWLTDALGALGFRVQRGVLPEGVGVVFPEAARVTRWRFPGPTSDGSFGRTPREGVLIPRGLVWGDLEGFALGVRAGRDVIVAPGDEVLAEVEGHPLLVRRGTELYCGFRPDLEEWDRDLAAFRVFAALANWSTGRAPDARTEAPRVRGLLDEGESRGRAGPRPERASPTGRADSPGASRYRTAVLLALGAALVVFFLRR